MAVPHPGHMHKQVLWARDWSELHGGVGNHSEKLVVSVPQGALSRRGTCTDDDGLIPLGRGECAVLSTSIRGHNWSKARSPPWHSTSGLSVRSALERTGMGTSCKFCKVPAQVAFLCAGRAILGSVCGGVGAHSWCTLTCFGDYLRLYALVIVAECGLGGETTPDTTTHCH